MTRPGIFLSYTRTKCAHEGTLEVILKTFSEKFAEYNIELIDPMNDLAGEDSKVSTDVFASIVRSDAMFVIEFPSVPNTSFEAGLATAFAIPIVFWLPAQLPGNERRGFHEYQRYLDQRDSKVALPSDQGDRKHTEFPGDLAASAEAQDRFKNLVDAYLKSLLLGPLSGHSVRARRRFRESMNLGARLLREYTADRDLCWILASLHAQHYLHLQQGLGARKFQIDESIYLTFLNMLSADPEGKKGTIAVADIESNIEKFWFQDGAMYPVGERIFRLPWRIFFHDDDLETFLRVARELSKSYPVYVTDTDNRRLYLQRLKTGIGGNFVVFDNVVGYYDQLDGNTKLVICQDKERSSALRLEFERSKGFSVQVTPDSLSQQIRRDWLEKRGIGVWPESYSGGDRRDDRYYDSYDLHIRVWIPDYEELSSKVAAAVISFASARLGRHKALVGEIGVGTGAVIQIVARWHDALLRAGFRALSRYIAVDTVPRMCAATDEAIRSFRSEGVFAAQRGRDFHALQAAVDGRKYDVVCGSLILHYLIEHNADGDYWVPFFDQLDQTLSADGIAVFGGPFFDHRPERRSKQIKWWQESMIEMGLSADLARSFIEKNPEMLAFGEGANTIAQHSKGRFHARLDRLSNHRSPFGVLTLTRSPMDSSTSRLSSDA